MYIYIYAKYTQLPKNRPPHPFFEKFGFWEIKILRTGKVGKLGSWRRKLNENNELSAKMTSQVLGSSGKSGKWVNLGVELGVLSFS